MSVVGVSLGGIYKLFRKPKVHSHNRCEDSHNKNSIEQLFEENESANSLLVSLLNGYLVVETDSTALSPTTRESNRILTTAVSIVLAP